MAQVIIGVDPHQRSATIEIINEREQAVGAGRFATDRDGYQAMLAAGASTYGAPRSIPGSAPGCPILRRQGASPVGTFRSPSGRAILAS